MPLCRTSRKRLETKYMAYTRRIIPKSFSLIHLVFISRTSKLGDYMVKSAIGTLGEVDAALFLMDASEGLGGGDRFIIEALKKVKTPVFFDHEQNG